MTTTTSITPPEDLRYCSYSHWGYLDGILNREPNPRFEHCTEYEMGWLHGQEDQNNPERLKVLEAPTVKRGDTVTVPKGTAIHSMKVGNTTAGRTYSVKLHDVYGMIQAGFDGGFVHPKPARVLWAGTGGYWCEANVFDVRKVEVANAAA